MVSTARGRIDRPSTDGSDSNLALTDSIMSMLTRVVGRKPPIWLSFQLRRRLERTSAPLPALPDLGDCAVPPRIQVDAGCLLVSVLTDAHRRLDHVSTDPSHSRDGRRRNSELRTSLSRLGKCAAGP